MSNLLLADILMAGSVHVGSRWHTEHKLAPLPLQSQPHPGPVWSGAYPFKCLKGFPSAIDGLAGGH